MVTVYLNVDDYVATFRMPCFNISWVGLFLCPYLWETLNLLFLYFFFHLFFNIKKKIFILCLFSKAEWGVALQYCERKLILLLTHDNSFFLFLTLDEIEFGVSDLGM